LTNKVIVNSLYSQKDTHSIIAESSHLTHGTNQSETRTLKEDSTLSNETSMFHYLEMAKPRSKKEEELVNPQRKGIGEGSSVVVQKSTKKVQAKNYGKENQEKAKKVEMNIT
jgi:hypothetical protein